MWGCSPNSSGGDTMKKSARLMVGILSVFALMILVGPKVAWAGEFAPQPEPPGKEQMVSSNLWTITTIQNGTVTVRNSLGQTKIIIETVPAGIKAGDKVRLQGDAVQQWVGQIATK
jgi:hypothetical protein